MAVAPSPGRIAWIERVIPEWSVRAAAVREQDHPSSTTRAAALDSIVARLRAELPHDTSPSIHAAEIARLEAIVAKCTGPYFHPEWGVMINDAPFLDDVHHTVRCKIARLRGLPDPPYLYRCTSPPGEEPAAPVPPAPPPEAVPFRAGPQLTLFEYPA